GAEAVLVQRHRRRPAVLEDGAVLLEPQVRLASVAEDDDVLTGRCELDEAVTADEAQLQLGGRLERDDLGAVVGGSGGVGGGRRGADEEEQPGEEGDERGLAGPPGPAGHRTSTTI